MYLNCHSYYSLRYGTISPEKLLFLAREHGLKTLVLTDINNTSACLDFVRLAPKYDVKPVLGVDFRNGTKQQFVLIAKNNLGFQHINSYLSTFLHDNLLRVPDRPLKLEHTFVIYPFEKGKHYELSVDEFIGIKPEDLNHFAFSDWNGQSHKLVVLKTVSFQDKKDFNTHRILRAINNNTLLSKLSSKEYGAQNDRFIPIKCLKDLYSDFPLLIQNTEQLLERCHIEFNFTKKTPQNQRHYTNNGALDYRLLKKLTYSGISHRYQKMDQTIQNRIEKELQIIKEKNYVSYFLINWKILKYARSKGYLYVGRGSGANSIVAYLLRITDVDPVELDLYFERFINLYRKNPPDFDLDFSWTDRDDIIKFVFKQFKHTALITVYNTFKYRSSVREIGKVFGLPKVEIDYLIKENNHPEHLNRISYIVLQYSRYIQGFPNYLGIHTGGVIISEKPIHYYCATFLPPKGFATTQIDMLTAEDIGLYKFDLLSQRGLGKIRDTLKIIQYNQPQSSSFNIFNIEKLKSDKRIAKILKNSGAIGCFYVESPAMRMLLKKLGVNNYLGLVAASSVIRPGVSKSGMMQQYILRHRYPEQRSEVHPVLLDLMPDTHGVMVYQEDVIKVAHHFGGLSLEQADILRRAMSGKFRSREEFSSVKETFFTNAQKLGRPAHLIKEVWIQIESFGGYAFAKGHSASYAVESYQSLFLKAYYPLEYMVAILNNGGGFYSREIYVYEARRLGAKIEAPCVNTSKDETIILGTTIYIGFDFIKNFALSIAHKITDDRQTRGSFKSLDDFIERIPIDIEQISLLIKINAFRFTKTNKRELLWEALMKVNKIPKQPTVTMFKPECISFKLPEFKISRLEIAFDEQELLGFPLCNPFELLCKNQHNSSLKAIELHRYIKKVISIEGYFVTVKNTITSDGKRMFFGTFIDRNGDFIDTVHFPSVVKRYPLRGRGIYIITGKVLSEFDCISIEVIAMYRKNFIQDPRYEEQVLEIMA